MVSADGGHVVAPSMMQKTFAFFQTLHMPWKTDDTTAATERESNAMPIMPPNEDVRRAQAHYEYMIPTLQELAKKSPNLKLLDVGCGSGSITIELARMMPEGHVTGVDISGAILESAKVHAEQAEVSNVDFVKGDVHSLPWPDETFDVVHTHQAVAHFHDHVGAIGELIRVTKKGGVVCMREGGLHTGRFRPNYPILDECFKVIIDVHEAMGGTSDAGRRLKDWTVQAGLPLDKISITQSSWTYDTLEGRKEYGGHWPARCTQGMFAEEAIKIGIQKRRLDEYAMAWKQWINDSDASFTMVHGEVIANV